MKIETKFDIGQKVWFQTLGINYKAEIMEINVHCLLCGDVLIHYKLARSGYYYERDEDELFPTKEELLKSL